MPEQAVVDVQSDERVAIFGQTGSGKTFFAKYLLRSVRRLVVVDPKGTLRGQWGLQEWSPRTRKLLRKGKPVRIRIASPISENQRAAWDAIFHEIYDAGDVVVYIDEMYGVVPIGTRAPVYLNAIYTRGRELGIGVWASSQRPAWIPREMISESQWFFQFKLIDEDDRIRSSKFIGPAALVEIPDDHGYYTRGASWSVDQTIYTPQLIVKRQKGAA